MKQSSHPESPLKVEQRTQRQISATLLSEFLSKASLASDDGNHCEAVYFLQKALCINPRRMLTLRDLANHYRLLNLLNESDNCLRALIAAKSSLGFALSGLAENARRRGDQSAAAAHFAEAVRHRPGDLALRRRLITTLRLAGDSAAHAAAIAQMAADFPVNIEAQVVAATAARADGRTEAEKAFLARALALVPRRSEAVMLAGALTRAGRNADALSILVLEAEESDPEILEQLAGLYARCGDADAAIAACERAVAGDPSRAKAWILLAGLAARNASAVRARAILAAARKAGVNEVALDIAEFDLLRNIGLDSAAEVVLDAARALVPADPRLSDRQATLDLDYGRFDAVADAIANMETQTTHQRVAAAMAAGRLAEARWQLPEALDAFIRALSLDPGNAAAHSAAARVLVGLLRPLEARRHLSEAKQLSRENQLARGRSLNPSQSLVGQLMSECWANQAAMQLGQAAITADRLDTFVTMVSEEPDYTPAAIAFFVFLRRKGMLNIRPPRKSAAPVSRRVLQFWDTEDVADDIAELMASWREGNPGWEHVRHTDRTARAFFETLPDPRVRKAYRAARKPAQKADLLRLALLFQGGGVYVDADDRCTAPLDALVAGRSLVVAQENRGSIGNNFIAAAPGHPLIGAALELAITAMLRGDADTIWLSTGPGLLTRAFAAHLAGSQISRAALGHELVVLERSELRRFCAPNCKVAYKTTTRHWSKEEFGQAV